MTGGDVMPPAQAPGASLLVQLAAVGPGEPLSAVTTLEQIDVCPPHVQRVTTHATVPKKIYFINFICIFIKKYKVSYSV